MKRTIQWTMVLFGIGLSFSSCYGDCYCDKELGCAILTVQKYRGASANTVVMTKIYCSQTNYHTDSTLRDSVNVFVSKYTTDSTMVNIKDSIYKSFDQIRVKGGMKQGSMKRFSDSGYSCNCPI